MKKIDYASTYKLETGDLRLQVFIGEGQFGSSLVTVGPNVLEQVHDFDAVLGNGAALKGRTLKVFSVVTDTNPQTNRTSVTYNLTGGQAPLEHTLTVTVDNESDSVAYEATFALV